MDEDAVTLRDANTCQRCGGRANRTILPLASDDQAFDLTHAITVCKACRNDPLDPRHALALEHLLNTGRAMADGFPYLAAQVRMIEAPLSPAPSLPALARDVVSLLATEEVRVEMDRVREAFPKWSERRIYRAIDRLSFHGYATLSSTGVYLVRLDRIARPPLLDDLTPVPDAPERIGHYLSSGRPADDAAFFLAGLQREAGRVDSRRQIRKFLLRRLPERAPGEAVLSLYNLLEVARILHRTPDGERWTFSRRLDRYTSLQVHRDMTYFLRHPEEHRVFKPRKAVLAERARAFRENRTQPKGGRRKNARGRSS